MNDRARAIEILKYARDMIAERLTERIIDARNDIAEDAMGLSYMGEIESVYEQLGGRLAHLNQMLVNLPPDRTEPDTSKAPPIAVAERPTALLNSPAADPSEPDTRTPADGPPEQAATFQMFFVQIQSADLECAARSLAQLLQIDRSRGRRCAETFLQQLTSDPDFVQHLLKLRRRMREGDTNESLLLLSKCFGLFGLELVAALQSLRTHLAAS